MPSLREIEDLVAEVHRNTERVRENAQQLAAMNVKQEIDAGLGVVIVSGYGVLRDVRLDPRALRTADLSRVGKRIAKAVHAAERKADQLRQNRTTPRVRQ